VLADPGHQGDDTADDRADGARAALAQILDSGPILIFRGNTRGFTITDASSNVERILGYSVGEFVEGPWIRLLHPDDRDRVAAEVGGIVERDVVEWEGRVRHADGSYRWVHTHVAGGAFHEDGARDVMGYVRDRTAEREAEERYRAISELTSDFAYSYRVLDDGTFEAEWASGAHEEITGYPIAEGLSWGSWAPILHPDDRPGFEAAIAGVLRGVPQDGEVRIIHRSGGVRWARIASRPVVDADGRVERIFGAATDITERKAAELALAESEAMLREAQAVANLGHWRIDLATGRHTWSDQTFRIFGLDPEGLVDPHPVFERIHHDDLDAVKSAGRRAFEQGVPAVYEFRYAHPDGRERWLQTTAVPVTDDEGEPLVLQGVTQDITERKHVEEALAASEASLREAQAVGRIGTFTADLRDGTIAWSPETYRLMGYEPGEVAPTIEWLVSRTYPDDRDEFIAALRDTLRAEDATDHEVRLLRRDGEVRWFHFRGQLGLDETGTPVSYRGMAQDITERKRIEMALAESEERFRRVVEESPLGVATFDMQRHVTLWSPAAERMLGWSAEEIIGRLPRTIPPDEAGAMEALGARVVGGESVTDVETRSVRKDGTIIHVTTSLAPIVDADGRTTGIISLFADISERKRLEEQLLQAQKMSALGRLAGGVAHDFNNLLTTILGHAEFLLDDAGDVPEVEGNASEIVAACERAARLTEQMLAFSRHRAPDAAVLDVNEVMGAFHEVLGRLGGPDVVLRTSPSSGPAWVRIARAQLEQVFLNLVVNARDAMPDGGRLDIDVTTAGDEVVIEVSDTGVGMEPGVKERVFEPFFTTRDAGTGLGLSVVYGVVEGAGGSITVESAPGAGARFEVRLPVAEASDAAGIDAPRPSGPMEGRESVLLVEDEDTVRALARRALEQRGYEVVEAVNGFDALSAVEERRVPFDALVTDLVMPGMSGTHLATTLQTRWPDLKVLYVSGYSEVAPDADAGPVHYLPKPFSPPRLVEAVRRMLDGLPVSAP
jgi:PAS domain S-box-containing protein